MTLPVDRVAFSPMQEGMEDCDEFTIVTALIVFPGVYNATLRSTNSSLAMDLSLSLVSAYTLKELHTHAHRPSVQALSDSYPSWSYESDDDDGVAGHSNNFTGDFDFCNNECALLMLKTASNNGKRPITGNYYELINGACTDSFTGQWYINKYSTTYLRLLPTSTHVGTNLYPHHLLTSWKDTSAVPWTLWMRFLMPWALHQVRRRLFPLEIHLVRPRNAFSQEIPPSQFHSSCCASSSPCISWRLFASSRNTVGSTDTRKRITPMC
jgi:hypothetical protein